MSAPESVTETAGKFVDLLLEVCSKEISVDGDLYQSEEDLISAEEQAERDQRELRNRLVQLFISAVNAVTSGRRG